MNMEDKAINDMAISLAQTQQELKVLKGQISDIMSSIAELREMAKAAYPKEYEECLRIEAEKLKQKEAKAYDGE
jgi:septal ring factor EnvC (AmiA/AmiB activator)